MEFGHKNKLFYRNFDVQVLIKYMINKTRLSNKSIKTQALESFFTAEGPGNTLYPSRSKQYYHFHGYLLIITPVSEARENDENYRFFLS